MHPGCAAAKASATRRAAVGSSVSLASELAW